MLESVGQFGLQLGNCEIGTLCDTLNFEIGKL